ncbi:MAG: MFS transporter, partial [Spirochaetaceae bacterium]
MSHRGDIALATRTGKLVVAACILASGVGFLMNSAVTIALPTVQRAFDATITEVQWIVNAYALALGSLILISGALGDLYGVRRVFNTGIAVFTAGSLAGAAAPSVGLLIAARAVQGTGAALMVPGSLAIITTLFPDAERGTVIGLWAGVSGAIAALGPFIGGFLAEVSWRFVFLAPAPLALAALAVSMLFLPPLRPGRSTRIDWLGAVLVACGLFALSFAFIGASRSVTGAESPVLLAGSALLGAGCLTAFVRHETRAAAPLVPYRMFTRQVAGANLATLFIYFSFSGTLFLLSFYLQQLLGYRATSAGLAVLPTTVLIALFSGPSGALTDKHGPRFQMIAGPAVVSAAVALLAAGDADTAYPGHILPAVIVLGVGIVLIIPSITTSALNVPRRFSGTASGVNNAVARISGLLAVAVVGTAVSVGFVGHLEPALAELPISESAQHGVMASADRLLALELPSGLGPREQRAVTAVLERAFVAGYRLGMMVNLA